jgi:hypothetical protein
MYCREFLFRVLKASPLTYFLIILYICILSHILISLSLSIGHPQVLRNCLLRKLPILGIHAPSSLCLPCACSLLFSCKRDKGAWMPKISNFLNRQFFNTYLWMLTYKVPGLHYLPKWYQKRKLITEYTTQPSQRAQMA